MRGQFIRYRIMAIKVPSLGRGEGAEKGGGIGEWSGAPFQSEMYLLKFCL